jgi:mono/diheme cytochrome c family protein
LILEIIRIQISLKIPKINPDNPSKILKIPIQTLKVYSNSTIDIKFFMEFYIFHTFAAVVFLIAVWMIWRLRDLKKTLGIAENIEKMPEMGVKQTLGHLAVGNLAAQAVVGILLCGLLFRFATAKPASKSTNGAKDTTAASPEKPKGSALDLATATVLTDEASLKAGAETFKNFCAACHGQSGEGLVGPNFTDNFWLHGGDFKDVCKTIVNGVPDKGMIAWASQLKGEEIQQVASFILSLEGSTPANPKAPQGEKYERKETIHFAIKPAAGAALNLPKIGLKGNKKKGETAFNASLGCAHCHGKDANGHVDNRNLKALIKRYGKVEALNVYDVVMEIGRAGTAMPAWKELTMQEKEDVKTFIFSLQEK